MATAAPSPAPGPGGGPLVPARSAPPRKRPRQRRSVIPGFGLTFGITLLWLGLVVLIPLSALFIRSAGLGPVHFVDAAFSARALAAYRLSFGSALAAAALNCFAGLLIAWVLVRYDFPGRRLMSALVDLPFALPTAVAGIALTAIYADTGWLGGLLRPGVRRLLGPQLRLPLLAARVQRQPDEQARDEQQGIDGELLDGQGHR